MEKSIMVTKKKTEPKTITIRKNVMYGEYRVPGKKGTEASAYYTDDKEDAVATAKAEHGKNVVIKFRSVRE
jgi:hypothetical protein